MFWIINHIANFILWLSYVLGLTFVPHWHNHDPWDEVEAPVVPGKGKAPAVGSLPIAQPDVRTSWGPSDPFKPAKIVEYTENQTDDAEWAYHRFDGTGGAPNYLPWSKYDDQALLENGWTTAVRIQNYQFCRAGVMSGKTNRLISADAGKSDKWSEPYTSAARKAISARLEDDAKSIGEG